MHKFESKSIFIAFLAKETHWDKGENGHYYNCYVIFNYTLINKDKGKVIPVTGHGDSYGFET
jgi:hypothetical protein